MAEIIKSSALVSGKRNRTRSFNGDASIKDLDTALRYSISELRSDVLLLAGFEELPESWKKKIKHELAKLGGYLTNYKGEQLSKYNEKQRLAVRLFCEHSNSLNQPYTKHHNPADYYNIISQETGYKPDSLRRLYKSFIQHRNGVTVYPVKCRASIILGIEDFEFAKQFEELWND